MSSRKSASTRVANEPTREEKAAFVKAMLHGIEPGSAAAKKSAAKRKATTAKAAKPKAAAKKTAAKSGAKPAKSAVKKPEAPASAGDAPKVEILRKISAPAAVETSAKSAEAIKLAQEIDAAVDRGELDLMQPHAVQALFRALVRLYAANDENDNIYPILPGRLAVSGTDAMVACGALLRAVDLQVFELGMFQNWSGR